jgi:D-alanyl-lipoteichoic acid acyltransferase DltB (MBOAT superfamily)
LFLPHLIAGPIVRLRQLGHQFECRKIFRERNLFIGAHLFTIGFIKKLIADPIGSVIAPVWAAPAQATSGALILALLGFSAQLFFDFSGYTDMARGIARMLGFRLPINFRAPFFARNPGDYYQRWHVSLSSWIRTFIYDTLAVAVLRRVRGRSRQDIALLAVVFFVMALFGLWHGAAWHFVLFGIAQGCVIAGWAIATRGRRPRSNAGLLGGMVVLQVTWLFSLIMFRADNLRDIGRYLVGLVHGGHWAPEGLLWCLLAMCVMVLVQAVDFSVRRRAVARTLCTIRGTRVGMALVAAVFLAALALKVDIDATHIAAQSPQNTSSFIYFRF